VLTELDFSDGTVLDLFKFIPHLKSVIFVTGAGNIRISLTFTQITGYSEQETIGKNMNLLQSGKQDKSCSQ